MKLRFLGTAHRPFGYKKSDLFCASVLIDGRVLVDPTDDVFRFASLYGMEDLFDRTDTVLITHTHLSHMSPDAVRRLSSRRPLTVIASASVTELLSDIGGITLCPIQPGMTVSLPAYRVTALAARHGTSTPAEVCLSFRIESDGHALFYGIDGGTLLPDTEAHLSLHPVDAMLLDGAYVDGATNHAEDHLTLPTAKEQAERSRAQGHLRGKGYILLSALPPYTDAQQKQRFTDAARREGFLVPYDGYFLEI